ncbi:DUF1801 domain-containing protein [Asticcacaulis solisilvae]|uniref:DUF1801 domain-containing protein n=1 Tax=Asticcacaulis solisilvae TaxID=1217274 RepID=UPI003FD8DE5C
MKAPGKTPRPAHYAVPKSDGDAAVQAWIDLLPAGWKQDRARLVDRIVTETFPEVQKAIKWHVAFYGKSGGGWIMAMAPFKAHIKLNFFDGVHLDPPPPVEMAKKPNQALDTREQDLFDEDQLADWIVQASFLPGWGKV